jgi:DNA-binding transcriptional LysR family regulator
VGYTITAAPTTRARRKPAETRDERLHVQPLARFSYRVVAPPGWGPQVRGRDWPELVRLPWVMTPPASVHHRLLAATLRPLGLSQNGVAQVDQESSMLALVRSGVGLSLARDALESQAHGIAVADRVSLDAVLGFACMAKARERDAVGCAFDALGRVWRADLA